MESHTSKSITVAELDWLFDHGFVISNTWIGPVEGVEYRLHIMGHQDVLAYRKSERACYNAAVRLAKNRVCHEHSQS